MYRRITHTNRTGRRPLHLQITRVTMVFHILVLAVHVFQVHSAVYTSLSRMAQLVKIEYSRIQNVKHFIEEERRKIEMIQRLLDQLESLHSKASADIDTYLSHPIHAYTFLQRFHNDWKDMDEIIFQQSDGNAQEYITEMKRIRRSREHPSTIDLKGAQRALIRLNDVYQYDPHQLISGELVPGSPCTECLNAADFMTIGLTAWEDGSASADIWLDTGRQLYKSNATHLTFSAPMLKGFELLASIAYKQSKIRRTLEIVDDILNFDAGNINAKKFKERILHDEEINMYNSLCRGDRDAIKVLPSNSAKCKYTHRNNPNLLLQPMKEEVVSLYPRVILFHDAITDSEISYLRSRANSNLTTGGAKIDSKDYRTNSVSWLDFEHIGDPLWRYLRRIQHYTGLSTESQHREWVQVANYGLGGHYYPHYDGRDLHKDELGVAHGNQGKRIATVLTYLTDVESGGATVFLPAQKRIQPSKGTAVFWYNYLRNGKLDYRTKHAACPVVMGTKWAANLWIRDIGQEFRRRCSLIESE